MFYISLLIDSSTHSIKQAIRYHILQNCLLPYGLGRDPFQIIEGTEPPEMHKRAIINWCDQLNGCKMDDGFIPFGQTIERTSRRTKTYMQFLTAVKYFGI